LFSTSTPARWTKTPVCARIVGLQKFEMLWIELPTTCELSPPPSKFVRVALTVDLGAQPVPRDEGHELT
jgi:hypothetical protein